MRGSQRSQADFLGTGRFALFGISFMTGIVRNWTIMVLSMSCCKSVPLHGHCRRAEGLLRLLSAERREPVSMGAGSRLVYPTDFSGDARDLNQSDRRQYPSPFAAAAHAWQEGNLNNMGGADDDQRQGRKARLLVSLTAFSLCKSALPLSETVPAASCMIVKHEVFCFSRCTA
ncbi:hypothetical protein Y1Q_0019986 [Alligator mississippiensis]|uniref:Uncharacterized protein n=1 Tax=Alligator mississippiensis TaxID=8496 RepID=A0A151PE77_ALLMI|nr:hypothetical protein Y1Q_0019986 [Alligator mississippiensis]